MPNSRRGSSDRFAVPFGNSFALLLIPFALVAGCFAKPPATGLPRVMYALEACVKLMQSVTDASSAENAVEQIKPVFDEATASLGELRSPGGGSGNAVADIASVLNFQKEMKIVAAKLDAETKRLDKLKGLPETFWTPFRLHSAEFALASLQMNPAVDADVASAANQIGAFYQQHGPQNVVELKLTGAPEPAKDAAVKKLHELAPGAEVVVVPDPRQFDHWLVAVAPVADFDALIAGVDFGTLVDSDKPKREATILVDPVDPAETQPAPPIAENAAPPADQPADPRAEQAPAVDPGANPPVDAAVVAAETGQRNPQFGDAVPPPGLPSDAGLPTDLPPTQAETYGRGEGLPQRGELAADQTPAAPREPQPTDADYHAQLAELLFDPQSPLHDKAVQTLLTVAPAAVPDAAVRKRIAQGFRHVAFESGGHPAEGARGLARWGGKFSQPLLIELLDKGDASTQDPIYAALAGFKTAEAAEAVVKRLVAAPSAEGAPFDCLKKMGLVAEPPLVAALPFETAETNLAALKLLADVGTKNCYAVLRQAVKSENEDVVAAARDALRRIQDRERAKKKTAVPAPPPPAQVPATDKHE